MGSERYRDAYARLVRRFLLNPDTVFKEPFSLHWTLSSESAIQPSVLIIGRAIRGPWGTMITERDFPVEYAMEKSASESMSWFGSMKDSSFQQCTLRILEGLPQNFRNLEAKPEDDFSWSELFKIATTKNPVWPDAWRQTELGLPDLIRSEVKVLKPRLVIALTQQGKHGQRSTGSGYLEDYIQQKFKKWSPESSFAGLIQEIDGVPWVAACHPERKRRDWIVEDVLRAVEEF